MSVLKAALGYVASTFVRDTMVRPKHMARAARLYCNRVGKPLLLIQPRGTIVKMFGPATQADVHVEQAAPLSYGDGAFGAILAVGSLERQRRPDLVMQEWRRVADRVHVIVPSWFSPAAWLDPRHRWVMDGDQKLAAPLWTPERGVYLLSVSDSRYGHLPWRPDRTPRPHPDPTKSAPESPDPRSSPSGSSSETYPPMSPAIGQLPPETSSGSPEASRPERKPSESSSYVNTLMVVSTHDSKRR